MKKRIFLLTAVCGFTYLVFSASAGGPALSSAGNRTGAQGSPAHCSAGSCHAFGTSTVVSITVDSGTSDTPVTHYVPGMLYTVKIHGTSSLSQPKFGFQFAAVSGTGISQAQAGAFPALPAPLHTATSGTLTLVEHGSPITAISPGIFDMSFQWIAPTTNVGDITLYCTLNAVNGNTMADPGDIANNTSVFLNPATPTAIGDASGKINVVAFPNPVCNHLNLIFEHAQTGRYSVSVFDGDGRAMLNEIVLVDGETHKNINTAHWQAGYYVMIVENNGRREVKPLMKW